MTVDAAAARRRLDAVMRWLVDDGHLSPIGETQIRKILDTEHIVEHPDNVTDRWDGRLIRSPRVEPYPKAEDLPYETTEHHEPGGER